jgi:hypothetical protein
MMLVMNIMIYMIFLWFLGIVKREKPKKQIVMVTLPCVFRKTRGKVTKTNSQNSAFAVRL